MYIGIDNNIVLWVVKCCKMLLRNIACYDQEFVLDYAKTLRRNASPVLGHAPCDGHRIHQVPTPLS